VISKGVVSDCVNTSKVNTRSGRPPLSADRKKMASNVQQVDITDLVMTTTERGRRRRNYTTVANRVKKELDDARKQKIHLSAAALNNWEQELQQLVEEALEANEQCMKNDPGRADDFNEWAEVLNE
jgi:DNA-binding transcriptional regulator GbsR (MarR family)